MLQRRIQYARPYPKNDDVVWQSNELQIHVSAWDGFAREVKVRVKFIRTHVDRAVGDAGVAFEVVREENRRVDAGVLAGRGMGQVKVVLRYVHEEWRFMDHACIPIERAT